MPTTRPTLLATDNDDLNLILDDNHGWDDPEYQTPIPDVSYAFIPFILF